LLKTLHDELLVRHNEVVETHKKCVVSSKQLREDHDKLLVKHNELIEKHDEVVVLNKSLESSNKNLKLDYANLNSKYQKLEFAFDDIDDELETLKTKNINASTSCETHGEVSKSFTNHDIPSSSKTNHDREKELEEELQNLTKCMFNVTRREYLHKEILFNNARHFGTKGLGSFPKPPENCPRSPELKNCFNKEVGSYCQHCQDVGIIQGSVLFLLALFPLCLLTISLNLTIITFC